MIVNSYNTTGLHLDLYLQRCTAPMKSPQQQKNQNAQTHTPHTQRLLCQRPLVAFLAREAIFRGEVMRESSEQGKAKPGNLALPHHRLLFPQH